MKKDLVKEKQLTGKVNYVMTVACTSLKAHFSNVQVSTLYFSGTVKVLCLKNPLQKLIMENISGARAPDDPDEIGCVKTAAITRAQSRLSTEAKPLKVAQVTDQSVVT